MGLFMERATCCVCGGPMDVEKSSGDVCLECRKNLQVVKTKKGLAITR